VKKCLELCAEFQRAAKGVSDLTAERDRLLALNREMLRQLEIQVRGHEGSCTCPVCLWVDKLEKEEHP
jgi:hypothetical protein